MALTGIDPNDPIPATRRELIFGAGLSSAGPNREVLMYGNKTTAGTEPTDTLGTFIADDSDAQVRFGVRSELYQMWQKYTAVDGGATIYAIAVPESGGDSAEAHFTFANNSDAVTTLEITVCGVLLYASVADGDTPTVIALAAADAINAGANATLPCTAVGNAAVCEITAANAGLRGNFVTGDATDLGIRMRFLKPTATTIVKSIAFPGTMADSGLAAIAEAGKSEFYYQVSPWHQNDTSTTLGNTAGITPTDAQTGELAAMITTQALPINGKEQCMISAFWDDTAASNAVGVDLNSVRSFVFHAEHNDWTPAMIAAQNAAVVRSQQISHPAANFAGYQNGDRTVYQMLTPFAVDDRPTTTEVRADLNNGISPISFSPSGKAYLVRFITTRNENQNANKDYRARPGHITSVIDFAWNLVKVRWESTKQPFVADNPKSGELPKAATTTPQIVDGMVRQVIDDLTNSTPLGVYQGPILAPDRISEMKSSLVVKKITAGISVSVDFYSVEHLYKGEFTIKETGAAY
jgi:phage tail sheath gpL-like